MAAASTAAARGGRASRPAASTVLRAVAVTCTLSTPTARRAYTRSPTGTKAAPSRGASGARKPSGHSAKAVRVPPAPWAGSNFAPTQTTAKAFIRPSLVSSMRRPGQSVVVACLVRSTMCRCSEAESAPDSTLRP